MKKRRIIFLLLVGMIMGVCLSVAFYFLTIGEISWKEYVEEKLVPNITLAMITILGIGTTTIPIIRKIESALSRFHKATDDINDTATNGKNTSEELHVLCEKVNNCMEEINKLEKITKIGFCNTSELVKNGYAAEIEKVGNEYDKDEKQVKP